MPAPSLGSALMGSSCWPRPRSQHHPADIGTAIGALHRRHHEGGRIRSTICSWTESRAGPEDLSGWMVRNRSEAGLFEVASLTRRKSQRHPPLRPQPSHHGDGRAGSGAAAQAIQQLRPLRRGGNNIGLPSQVWPWRKAARQLDPVQPWRCGGVLLLAALYESFVTLWSFCSPFLALMGALIGLKLRGLLWMSTVRWACWW